MLTQNSGRQAGTTRGPTESGPHLSQIYSDWKPTQAALMNAVATSAPELGASEFKLLMIYLAQLDNRRLQAGDARIFCPAHVAAAIAGFHPSSIKAMKGRLIAGGWITAGNGPWIDLAPIAARHSALRSKAAAIKLAAKGASRRAAKLDPDAVSGLPLPASSNSAGGRSATPHIQTPSFARLSDTVLEGPAPSKMGPDSNADPTNPEAPKAKTRTRTSQKQKEEGCSRMGAGGSNGFYTEPSGIADGGRGDSIFAVERVEKLRSYVQDIDLERAAPEVISVALRRAADELLTTQRARHCGLFWDYAEQSRGLWRAAELLAYVLADPALTGVRDPAKVFSWYGNRDRTPAELGFLGVYLAKFRAGLADLANTEAPPAEPAFEAAADPEDPHLTALRAAVRHHIETGPNPLAWRTWFASLEFLGLDGGRLTLAARSRFLADELAKRDGEILAAARRFGVSSIRIETRPRQ